MSKFIMIGGEIINRDLLGYVRIVEPGDPFLRSNPSVPAYSVIYAIGQAITVKPIFNTYAEAKEWVDNLFKILEPGKKEAENSDQPVIVSFEKYCDKWVKAKLVCKNGRLRALKEGEVYMIKPFVSYSDRQCVAVRDCSLQGERKYCWDDVQFVLAGQKKGESQC